MRVRVCDLTKERLNKENPVAPDSLGVTIGGETFLVTVHRQVSGGRVRGFKPADLCEKGLDTILALARYHARRFWRNGGDLTPNYHEIRVED